MKVAHCIHGLGLGGAQQVIRFIVGGSDRRTYRYHVYSCSDGVLARGISQAGATIRIIPRRIPKFDPVWVVNLASAMRGDSIDVVHVHLFGDSLHGYLASRLAGGLPVVMTLHNSGAFHTRLQRLGYQWLMSHTARNIACSESARRSFMDKANGTGVNIETISNGIKPVLQAPPSTTEVEGLKHRLGLDPSVTVIGAVGRMVKEKGFAHLIRAFAELCQVEDSGLQLVLLGDGPLREALVGQAVRAGVGNRVLFPGFRPDAAELIRGFDIVAFSSIFEGLPIALLEAMAASRCIVGTNAAGLMNAVTAEREALVVPVGNATRLAAALRQAVRQPALRERLGRAARQRFLAEFTAERMVARYEGIYREVYARTHPRF